MLDTLHSTFGHLGVELKEGGMGIRLDQIVLPVLLCWRGKGRGGCFGGVSSISAVDAT